MNEYPAGTGVKCRELFYTTPDKTTLADPTTITFRFRDPDGNQTAWVYGTDSELVRSSTGDYYAIVPTDESGVWDYEFEGTGTVDIISVGKFVATPTLGYP